MKIRRRWFIYIPAIIFGIMLNFKEFFTEPFMYAGLLNEHIVMAFTTTPHRINDIEPTIKSLLVQNAPLKAIYVSIPYKFERDNLEYEIPKWLSDNKKITILRSKDYGPATKLLGVLEQVKLPPNAIIITVDDDIYYPRNLALQLAYKAKRNPNYAIAISGANLDPEDSWRGLRNNTTPDAFVSVVQGFSGIAYRRSFFDADIFNIVHAPRECINSDDLYISFDLAKHNIKRQVLLNDFIKYNKIIWDNPVGLKDDALHNQQHQKHRHEACVAYMKAKDPKVIF